MAAALSFLMSPLPQQFFYATQQYYSGGSFTAALMDGTYTHYPAQCSADVIPVYAEWPLHAQSSPLAASAPPPPSHRPPPPPQPPDDPEGDDREDSLIHDLFGRPGRPGTAHFFVADDAGEAVHLPGGDAPDGDAATANEWTAAFIHGSEGRGGEGAVGGEDAVDIAAHEMCYDAAYATRDDESEWRDSELTTYLWQLVSDGNLAALAALLEDDPILVRSSLASLASLAPSPRHVVFVSVVAAPPPRSLRRARQSNGFARGVGAPTYPSLFPAPLACAGAAPRRCLRPPPATHRCRPP